MKGGKKMDLTEQINQKLDLLDKIYLARQEELEQQTKQDRQTLKKQLNEVKLEEIQQAVIKGFQKVENIEKEDVIHKIELLIENYELQIAYYSEKNYKRGFKDAVCLYTQCLNEQ